MHPWRFTKTVLLMRQRTDIFVQVNNEFSEGSCRRFLEAYFVLDQAAPFDIAEQPLNDDQDLLVQS